MSEISVEKDADGEAKDECEKDEKRQVEGAGNRSGVDESEEAKHLGEVNITGLPVGRDGDWWLRHDR
jgi:hypothetical protein